jgi:PPOX class probable F420-dependent enzyme
VTTPLTQEQERFLARQRVAHLATVDAAGNPHVVPICFAWLDGAVYTAIDEKPKRVDAASDPRALRRVRNILGHPNVCLVVDRYDEDWTKLAWLQVRGVATLVTAGTEHERASAALRDRYPQYQVMDLESAPLIRVMPVQIVAWQAAPPWAGAEPASAQPQV